MEKGKIISFLINLKPYRRLYKLFWLEVVFIFCVLFEILMFSLSYAVPHNRGGFYYFMHGWHSLGEVYSEPNSASGFIIAGFILGYAITIILTIPIYFIFAKWFLYEWLSEKPRFINVKAEKYQKWSLFFHILAIGVVFSIASSIFIKIGGGIPLPHKAYITIDKIFSDIVSERLGGVFVILYYSLGLGCLIYILIWLIIMVLALFFGWMRSQFDKLSVWRSARKDDKLARKLDRIESKRDSKNK